MEIYYQLTRTGPYKLPLLKCTQHLIFIPKQLSSITDRNSSQGVTVNVTVFDLG
jgi:hypothetical protein